MKTVVYLGPRRLAVEDRPTPSLVDGEVLLRVEAVGVCGSELHGYLGHDSTRLPGMIFGHEVAGEVVASAAPDIKPGIRVTCNSAYHCGVCEFCLQGRDNHCIERKSIGKWRPGGYAEYLSLPRSMLIPIPQEMPPVHAALVEPLATPLHGVHQAMRVMARPIAESATLVIGAGAIGFLAILLLRHYGVATVDLIEPNSERAKLASRHSGCRLIDDAQPGVYELVFDAVGSSRSFETAMKAVRRGGVIAEVGLQDQVAEIDIQRLVRSGIMIVGGANYPTVELHAAVRLIAGGLLGDTEWVERRSLNEAPVVFDELTRGHPKPKVVLVP